MIYAQIFVGLVMLAGAAMAFALAKVQPKAYRVIDEIFDRPGSAWYRRLSSMDPTSRGFYPSRVKQAVLMTLIGALLLGSGIVRLIVGH